jgi:hypothetical protein
MTILDARAESSQPAFGKGSRRLIRWVCTSNPFYVLSALLVCLGLWVSFGSQVDAAHTWALLIGMSGYILLLAVTACLLVRFVGVWDDVRTVLLLVVLLFLALSVTFDEVLASNQTRGITCYLGGLLFALAVSEGLLRGTGLRLPALFRAPYHAILGLFFLYPIALTPLLDQPRSDALCWSLFGFSPAAGLVFLTLLPAIRRGRGYVRDNGSPWPWAWYPWTLFGVLGFGVAARSALLCWSMHHIPSGEIEPYIFGPYFLVPFGLAIGVLLLEIGLVEGRRGVVHLALLVPAALVVLTVLGHRADPIYQSFLASFSERLGGTPLYLTLVAAAAFYAYATLRRVPMAFDALTAVIIALAFVAPPTIDLGGLVPPRALPIGAAAVLQLAAGLRRHEAWRCLVGATCAVATALVTTSRIGAGSYQGPVSFHLIVAAALLVGAMFDDRLGRFLRTMGSMLALAGALAIVTGRVEPTATVFRWLVEVYPLAVALIVAGYGLVLEHRVSLVSAGLILAAWLAAAGWRGYSSLRHIVVGIDYIAIGMALFSLAVLTSMVKGGVLAGHTAPKRGAVVDTTD